MSQQLYKQVFEKMPTGITHVGMTVSKDKAHKQRYAHIKASCAKHRAAQSRGQKERTEKTVGSLPECRYLWGTSKHPHQMLSIPARPGAAEADNCIHTLRTSQQWGPTEESMFNSIHGHMCSTYGVRHTNMPDSYMATNLSFTSALQINPRVSPEGIKKKKNQTRQKD